MNDHLDRDTGERMLRGEDTGPRPLAGLLAAASAPPRRDDRRGEEAAVAAFRAARAGLHVAAPAARRLLRPRVQALKTAFAGLLLALAGGIAVASPHLVSSSGHRHSRSPRPSVTDDGSTRRGGPPVPSRPSPSVSPTPEHTPRHVHKGQRYTPHGHGHEKGHGKGKGPASPIPSVPVPPLPTATLPGHLPTPLRGGPAKGRSPSLLPSLSPGCDALCDPDG